MDETMKAEVMALMQEACKPIYERMDKIEKMMMPAEDGEGEGEEVEITVGTEGEEMRSLKAQVAELRAAADEARFEAWRASNAPALDAEVARHIYAAPDAVRAKMVTLATPKGGTTPSLPALGAGSGMREAVAKPKTAKEAWEAVKAKHGNNRAAADAEWAQVREQYR